MHNKDLLYSTWNSTQYSVITYMGKKKKKKSKKEWIHVHVGFQGGTRSKEHICNAGEQEVQIWPLGWEDPLVESMTTHSSYYCLENPMDRGPWWAIAHRVSQSWKRLKWLMTRGQTSSDGQHWNQIDHILCSQRWRSSIQSAKIRPGADCGLDHDLLIAKFRLKLKKVGKTTRSFMYDLN